MNKEELHDLKKRFLTNRDDTGRFVVKSLLTGKTYFVEAIDGKDRPEWGDKDPATGKLQTSNYGKKHRGSISEDESMITEENGFTKIHRLGVGESPLAYIDKIDREYYEKHKEVK